jgi:hypothetical protein
MPDEHSRLKVADFTEQHAVNGTGGETIGISGFAPGAEFHPFAFERASRLGSEDRKAHPARLAAGFNTRQIERNRVVLKHAVTGYEHSAVLSIVPAKRDEPQE